MRQPHEISFGVVLQILIHHDDSGGGQTAIKREECEARCCYVQVAGDAHRSLPSGPAVAMVLDRNLRRTNPARLEKG